MRLAFSTNAFVKYSLESAIQKIAGCKYKGVEILADRPHFPPTLKSSWKRIKSLQKMLSQSNIEVSNINANTASVFYKQVLQEPVFEPSLSNPDITKRRWRIDYTKRSIDLACEVQSKSVSITSGIPLPDCPPEKGKKLFIESVKRIMDYAEKKGIKVGLEYEPCLLYENTAEVLGLVNTIKSKYFGVNLDLGHVSISEKDPVQSIRKFKNCIWNIHIEDIKDKKHFHLIPGQGDMDFTKIFKVLREIKYDNFITVELYTYQKQPVSAARKSYDFLNRFI